MESLFEFFVFEWKGTQNCFVANHILQEVQYLILWLNHQNSYEKKGYFWCRLFKIEKR